jgi:hypothetical protein
MDERQMLESAYHSHPNDQVADVKTLNTYVFRSSLQVPSGIHDGLF